MKTLLPIILLCALAGCAGRPHVPDWPGVSRSRDRVRARAHFAAWIPDLRIPSFRQLSRAPVSRALTICVAVAAAAVAVAAIAKPVTVYHVVQVDVELTT